MSDGERSIVELSARLRDSHDLAPSLDLVVGARAIRIHSNSTELLAELRSYFGDFAQRFDRSDITVGVIEAEQPVFDLEFVDWPRPPGKLRKASYADLEDGRAVLQVRSGRDLARRAPALGTCRACRPRPWVARCCPM